MSAAPSVEALSTTITSTRSRCRFGRTESRQARRSSLQFQLAMQTETIGRFPARGAECRRRKSSALPGKAVLAAAIAALVGAAPNSVDAIKAVAS